MAKKNRLLLYAAIPRCVWAIGKVG